MKLAKVQRPVNPLNILKEISLLESLISQGHPPQKKKKKKKD